MRKSDIVVDNVHCDRDGDMPSWDVHFDVRIDFRNVELLQLTAQVDALASVIRGIPIPPSVQQRLDRLNIIRAVRGTTGIEGTEFSEEEVAAILESQPTSHADSADREEQEVRNAEALMRDVAELLRREPHAPLTENLVHRFHAILTQGISYSHNEPGRYRNHRVTVGRYAPPQTGDDVRERMAAFMNWFNTGERTRWSPVIRSVVAHFYVVSIHPFGDGNGRTSRAVESYLLYQAGINARGFYSLANYYYENRSEYVRHLGLVQLQITNDLTPFILFALKGLLEELKAVHAEVLEEVRIISFRDFARETLGSQGRLGARGERLLNFVIALSAQTVSMSDLRNRIHPLSRFYAEVTSRTLTRDVRFLERQGLVRIEDGNIKANLDIMDKFTA